MHAVINTHQAEAWDGQEGEHWAANQDRWDAVSEELNEHLIEGAAIGARDRVVDIGCGNGRSTRSAAKRAALGHALGLDLSGPMLERARASAAGEGIDNVRFEQGDAQIYPFEPAAFDLAISRGGIMFFADPAAAFANIGAALRTGGRLVFVCPMEVHRQDWFTVPMTTLLGRAPAPASPDEPGMFSLGERTHLTNVLAKAGFQNITTNETVVRMTYGRDAEDAADFFLGMRPTQFHLSQTGRTGNDVRDGMIAALRPYESAEGVRLGGSFWLVSAVRP